MAIGASATNQQLTDKPYKASTYGYMIAFAAAMGGLLFGYEIGVISQTLDMPGFKTTWGISSIQDGVLVDLDKKTVPSLTTFTFLAGCFVGAFFVSYLADALGRKRSIVLGGSVFLGGAALQTFSQSLAVFYVGRVISGLSIGCLSMVAPLYISEASPAEIRGTMVTVQQFMITIGIFIASCINSVIIVTLEDKNNDLEWRLAMGMQMAPAVLLLVVMTFMPESPRWLATKSRDGEALATIAKLRAEKITDEASQKEFKHIQQSIEQERLVGNGAWSELFVPGLRNRFWIAVVMQMFQQMTGINVILYYQGSLFTGMGIDPKAAAIPFTIANTFINMVSTIPGMYLIERVGRRKLLLLGGLGMGVAHYLVCTFIGLSKSTGNGALSWGAIFSVYLFFFSFASTWGPIAWVYQSEIFPLRVRAKGTGAATMSNWFWNAIIALVTPYIQDAIGFWMYLIYGTTGLTMAAFIYFFVPETKGKSLEDMDDIFGKPENAAFEYKQKA
ncbi:sugar transporter [Gorgonomyces haynaldii]|nr:sugar transporter [Gorgonomyces haynaldii]